MTPGFAGSFVDSCTCGSAQEGEDSLGSAYGSTPLASPGTWEVATVARSAAPGGGRLRSGIRHHSAGSPRGTDTGDSFTFFWRFKPSRVTASDPASPATEHNIKVKRAGKVYVKMNDTIDITTSALDSLWSDQRKRDRKINAKAIREGGGKEERKEGTGKEKGEAARADGLPRPRSPHKHL